MMSVSWQCPLTCRPRRQRRSRVYSGASRRNGGWGRYMNWTETKLVGKQAITSQWSQSSSRPILPSWENQVFVRFTFSYIQDGNISETQVFVTFSPNVKTAHKLLWFYCDNMSKTKWWSSRATWSNINNGNQIKYLVFMSILLWSVYWSSQFCSSFNEKKKFRTQTWVSVSNTLQLSHGDSHPVENNENFSNTFRSVFSPHKKFHLEIRN